MLLRSNGKDKYGIYLNTLSGKTVIDGATLLCTYRPEIINQEVSTYWDNIHKLSTNKQKK